ncbi:MAG: hypothetical protein JWN15_44, partial [Firmicutes bacterium]|nr:hypothetical protein [Bacillota bacterium]
MSLELEPLHTRTVMDEASLKLFLDRLEEQLERVSAVYAQLLFEQYQTRQRPRGMEAAEATQAALTINPEYQAVVARFLGRVGDPLLARRLVAWDQAFRSARVSARP